MLKEEMKKCLLMAVATATTIAATAETQESDTMAVFRSEQMNEVVVAGVRAPKNAPFAVANIGKTELQDFSVSGRELPFLLSNTPGVMSWSDNGMGTGTSYLRIRGAGDSRINITIDGVPLNSPEDQCVFWANMNSYSSLLGNIQVQRGVGSSTNGDGAFGGSVSLSMKAPEEKATAELTGSAGSYNTYHYGGSFSTGLLWNHFIFDGAYHETITDGFIHGTNGRSGSYMGRLTYQGDNFTVAYRNFGNFEKTGQAWNGVTAGNDDMSLMDGTYGTQTGIHTYKNMFDAGLGKFNSLYEQLVINDDGTYSTQRYAMADGSLWKKTTDNFWQNHNILSAVWKINTNWNATASLHYTHGDGYYDEFRPNNKLSKFGMATFTDAEGNKVKRTDFVRQKGYTQNAYGAIANVNYKDESWDIIGGFSAQKFKAHHKGYVTYILHPELAARYLNNGKYQHYDSNSEKIDVSTFVKATFHLTSMWDIFADMQYRHVGYECFGAHDRFVENEDGSYRNFMLNIDKSYNFYNPKAGVAFHQGPHHAYASFAMSNREPERNNFTDNGSYPSPKAEKLFDYEVGYDYNDNRLRAGINAYFMNYKDQFVQTGAVSDIGENLTTNIKKSYRAGIELNAGYKLTPWLTIEGNAALSINKIKDFNEFVEDWDDWEGNPDAAAMHTDGNGDELREFHYSNSTLAFSPSAILNGFANFHYKGFTAVWHTNFVSRQYLDNTENKERSLPSFSTSNLTLEYASKVEKALGLKEVVLSLSINNILNRRYAAYGWVYSAICESYGHSNDNRYYQIGFTPSAGTTAMASLTLRF